MTCQKMGYVTEASAKRALRAVQQKGRRHRERRVYLCPDCRWFHLTKEPSDERKVERMERAKAATAAPAADYWWND